MTQDNPILDVIAEPPVPVDPIVLRDENAQAVRAELAADRPVTVGATVHYFPAPIDGVGPWAALVTQVHQAGWVDLTTFPPGKPPLPLRGVGLRIEGDVNNKWDWPDAE